MKAPRAHRSDREIFFDDVPIESLVYGKGGDGPSSARVFGEAHAEAEAILADMSAGKTRDGIRRIVRLLDSERPVPLTVCTQFVQAFYALVPLCPRPLLPEGTDDSGAALVALVSRAERHGAHSLSSRARTVLYRWHEGRGEYAEARCVIGRMLERTEHTSDARLAAILTNNYGYEYLLEGRAAEAEPHFERALDRFVRLEEVSEVDNVKANVLTCRFARSDPIRWDDLMKDIRATHRALRRARDWRARKTMRLLAEASAARGEMTASRSWARRAVAASANVPTRLTEDDMQFLRGLEQ